MGGQRRRLGESATCCRWTPDGMCPSTSEGCTRFMEYLEHKTTTHSFEAAEQCLGNDPSTWKASFNGATSNVTLSSGGDTASVVPTPLKVTHSANCSSQAPILTLQMDTVVLGGLTVGSVLLPGLNGRHLVLNDLLTHLSRQNGLNFERPSLSVCIKSCRLHHGDSLPMYVRFNTDQTSVSRSTACTDTEKVTIERGSDAGPPEYSNNGGRGPPYEYRFVSTHGTCLKYGDGNQWTQGALAWGGWETFGIYEPTRATGGAGVKSWGHQSRLEFDAHKNAEDDTTGSYMHGGMPCVVIRSIEGECNLQIHPDNGAISCSTDVGYWQAFYFEEV